MTPPLFTVLLPVVRPPATLPYAIESVLGQTEASFELCVICDGAPPETEACARSYTERDPRVKVFPFPKGERNGEAHRHTVLSEAHSRYVAQIADDDIWFPDHLAELAALLAEVDFGNLPQVDVSPQGEPKSKFGDLADPAHRRQILETRWYFFGPTVCGYRLDAYRRLPQGWAPAPPDMNTDLHMWKKFLAREELTFGTRFAVTAAHIHTSKARKLMTFDARAAESRYWLECSRDPEKRAAFVRKVFAFAFRKAARRKLEDMQKKEIEAVRRNFYWRIREAAGRIWRGSRADPRG